MLYLREVNSYLALVCLLRADNLTKRGLIDYNIDCFKRALAQISKERDALERESQQALQKATHKLSTLELKYGAKEEQVHGLKLQCETLRRQEAALRKENEGLKKIVHGV